MTVDCSDGGTDCGKRHTLVEYTPRTAWISVISGGDTTAVQVTPEYTVSTPNGPNCEPTCRQASVRVGFDEGTSP